MLSSSSTKAYTVSMTSSRIITLTSTNSGNGQSIRADGLGNIYFIGNTPSNYTVYNTRTGSSTTGLVASVDFNNTSWDVDASGVVYYMVGLALYAVGGAYGSTPSNIITALSGTTVYTKTLSVNPAGTTITIQVDGNLSSYTAWSGGSATSNLLLASAYGTGRISSSMDSAGNVYIAGRPDIAASNAVLKVTSAGASSSFSSNAYGNCGSIAFDKSSGDAIIATVTSVYRVKPTKDVQIASGFSNIQGVSIDPVSKIMYVLECGGGAPGIYRLAPNY